MNRRGFLSLAPALAIFATGFKAIARAAGESSASIQVFGKCAENELIISDLIDAESLGLTSPAIAGPSLAAIQTAIPIAPIPNSVPSIQARSILAAPIESLTPQSWPGSNPDPLSSNSPSLESRNPSVARPGRGGDPVAAATGMAGRGA